MSDLQTSNGAGAPRVRPGSISGVRPQDAVFLNSPWVFNTCETKPSYRPTAELIALSERIGRIQKLAKREFGYGTVWIAGRFQPPGNADPEDVVVGYRLR